MEAFRVAVRGGISPTEFWGLTPHLTRQALPALAERHNTTIWLQAALMRTKRLPELEKFAGRPKEQGPPADLEAKMKALFKNEKVVHGKVKR